MAINKNVTLNSQQGGVEATVTSASGKSAVVKFSYTWDELTKEPLFYSEGLVIIDEEEVAKFSFQRTKGFDLIVRDYVSLADYAEMIQGVITEFENSMK